MTTERNWLAGDGARLFCRLDDYTDPWEPAPVVVLLHPAMGSSQRLYAWVPHLARDFLVARPDLRGHGHSEAALDRDLTHERLARDVVELLDQLGCERAHLTGSSAGGIIALQAALRYPARVASLALYAATAGIHPDRPKKGDWLARVAKSGVRQFLTETLRERIGEASPERARWFLDTAEGVTPEFLARFVPLMASEYFPDRLSQLTCPVLMVVPDPDPMVERHEYELMRVKLRDCRFVTIPGASHSMTAEIPDRCAVELRQFLLGLAQR